ncbi:MAG TPA: ABC transporter ATP-binding protein [Candidatus Polarisedimenticolaceae bacterium]|nr:ABC transporter ATP-binding protein [Candidatus Polarisedimenticolaceae bacterium]
MDPGVVRGIWRFLQPYRSRYAVGLAWLLATNALALGIPWLLRAAVHELEAGTTRRTLAVYALGIVALALVQSLTRTLSRLAILGASRLAAYDVREAFFAKLLTLDARFYDTQRTGDIMSRGVNDLQLLQSFYGPGLMNALNTAIVYVAVLAVMLSLDASLTIVALGLFPALYFAVNRLSRRVYARSLAVQEQLAEISNRAQENISGIQQVKIYAQEDREIARFAALCDDFRRRNLSLARVRGLMVALIGVVSGLGTLLVLFVGGLHVIRGRISLGDFVAFNAYLAQLAWPTIALGWIVNVFQRAAGAMRRLDEVFAAEPSIPAPEWGQAPFRLRETVPDPVSGDIAIRDLTFSYDGDRGTPALSGITVSIPSGSRVAIVGPVGSGKSTLAHLLARIYPAPSGSITIGGEDVSAVPVERVRDGIGFVPQEAFLFSRSLRDNVAFGQPEAPLSEVERAVALSRLDADLPAFPKGLDTIVGERGITLSGGQRQRATLARALLGRPGIVLLDDALSAVDADTERAILTALAGRTRSTLILITHRFSALHAVDRILVLHEGKLVEDGTHDDLLRADGVYARLHRRQSLEERLTG